jgi:hypothetical protein
MFTSFWKKLSHLCMSLLVWLRPWSPNRPVAKIWKQCPWTRERQPIIGTHIASKLGSNHWVIIIECRFKTCLPRVISVFVCCTCIYRSLYWTLSLSVCHVTNLQMYLLQCIPTLQYHEIAKMKPSRLDDIFSPVFKNTAASYSLQLNVLP